eukprot:CAMPEP_0170122602 /NCGR_PEP_ID=MMETSP0020_2-20130122/16830_1 /TAXON_ID=98059 /ORGANISM="Dinobryon sp., Strain UTEXLB2267" /LENGTH=201 /DNA_ID=CAMNT_0010353677 /DNA_START=132 /DNA_END=734 /DNA_ORIENTATION=-
MVTGGTLSYTLSKRSWRLILALMIRESIVTLLKASRGGTWHPDLMLVSSWLTPWILEMLLVFPTPLCQLLVYFALGSLAKKQADGMGSPGLQDLAEGRKTMADWHLAEIVETGRRYGCETSVLQLVLDAVRRLEVSTSQSTPSKPSASNQSHDATIDKMEKDFSSLLSLRRNSHATVAEATFWFMRGLLILSIAALVLFLF